MKKVKENPKFRASDVKKLIGLVLSIERNSHFKTNIFRYSHGIIDIVFVSPEDNRTNVMVDKNILSAIDTISNISNNRHKNVINTTIPSLNGRHF